MEWDNSHQNFTSERMDETMPRHIHLIATGGTIAGTGQAGKTSGYEAGSLPVRSLLDTLPPLPEDLQLTAEQLCSIDSNQVDSALWLRLARHINQLAQTDIDGFVITHGTDTMDETAYFLNLTVKTEKPVILTGAMRPSTAASADGPLNLYQAIHLAAKPEAAGKGILVCFCDSIYSGRDVQKVNTYKTDAFNEKDLSCLGYMRDDQCYFLNASLAVHTTASCFDVSGLTELPRVDILYFYAGAPADALDFYASRARGLVIAGTGSGNYSPQWVEKIRQLSRLCIPVIRSSRIGHGIVSRDPHFEGSDNCIPAYTLPPQKARILLSLALTVTDSYAEIEEIFRKY